MAQYRKKPVIIEAVQYTATGPDNHYDIMQLAGAGVKDVEFNRATTPPGVIIHTLEGDMKADVGDWIIKGVKGELYPCKPDIFEATYEAVDARGVSIAHPPK